MRKVKKNSENRVPASRSFIDHTDCGYVYTLYYYDNIGGVPTSACFMDHRDAMEGHRSKAIYIYRAVEGGWYIGDASEHEVLEPTKYPSRASAWLAARLSS